MQGKVTRHNKPDDKIAMTGDLELAGGRWDVPKFTTNGHVLTISCPVWGATVDGEKNHLLWPDNMVINYPLTAAMLDKNHTWKEHSPLPWFLDFKRAMKRGGPDAKEAWIIFVTAIHGSGDAIEWSDFQTVYSDVAGENVTHLSGLVSLVKPFLPGGFEWPEIREYINGKTLDQLRGKPTELVREIA